MSIRSKFWHAWKGFVPNHMCVKYKRCISLSIGAIFNFLKAKRRLRNLNADYEVKVKVKVVKFWHAWKGLVQRQIIKPRRRL